MQDIEYCYDKSGNQLEVGPGFKLVEGGEGDCLSCPICRACTHQIYNEEQYPVCEVLNPVPEDIDMGYVFKCDHYEADKNSIDYKLVTALMEKGKSAETMDMVKEHT